VSDVVSGNLSWLIAQRWRADLAGSFERREQATENFVLRTQVSNQPSGLPAFPSAAQASAIRAVQVDNGTGVDVMNANLRIAYQLASRAALYVSAAWWEQSFTGNASSVESAQRFSLTIGVNYNFDPVSF
jgi:predicted porin